MVICLFIFHTPTLKECWGCKKSSGGKLAKVRIKNDTSSIEIPLIAGSSELQHRKQKSLVSQYSCFLSKILEYLATVSVSFHPSVSHCVWIGNALFLHDLYKQRGSIWAFKVPTHTVSHVANTENILCYKLDSGGESGRLGGNVCHHCSGTLLPRHLSESCQNSSGDANGCSLPLQSQGRGLKPAN